MKMRKNKLVAITAAVMALALCLNVQAETFHKYGTVAAVDLDNNSFSVNMRNGETKVFSFPEKVSIIVNGATLHDKSLIVPGQPVNLKFSREDVAETTTAANDMQPTMTLSGTVIKLDRAARNGSLRQARTGNIIPFRFAEDFSNFKMPRIGDEVVFTYVLDSVKVGMK